MPDYKLFIGCPTYGSPHPLFSMDSLGSLLYHIGRRCPEIKDVVFQRDVRTYRQEARQAIVMAALEAGATHLLMLDDDHVFGSETWDKLWTSVRDNPEVRVCSALYYTRGLPTVPCIWKLTSKGTVPILYYPQDELFEVEVVGFGMILFDLNVFREINPPWFNLALGFGEDAAFCARLIHQGIRIWCHTGARAGHILETPHVITEADYVRTRDQISLSDVGTPQLMQIGGPSREQLEQRNEVESGSRWWRAPHSHQWNLNRVFRRFWPKSGFTLKGEPAGEVPEAREASPREP